MDDFIAEQVESLLGTNYSIKGLNKSILTLAGFLGEPPFPEPIGAQLESLSKLAVLQDLFESLMHALNHATGPSTKARVETSGETLVMASRDLPRLLDQIEAVRTEISACGPINYSVLIAWLVGRARERNLLRQRTRR